MPWYKGNLHTHTNKSDGDSSPEVVTNWYEKNGYDFLVLSDHNHLTILDHKSSLLLIPGEEITLNVPYSIHVNAIGINKVIEPTIRSSKVKTLQANINNIIKAGGLAQINHPNFRWSLSGDDLVQIKSAHFLEIFNGNLDTHNYGGGGKKSVEEMWDQVLSSGIAIWGVAVDDSHHFQGEFSPRMHNPGRGWIVVNSDRLSEESILKSLYKGDFYFTTGIKFQEITIERNTIQIKILGDEMVGGIGNLISDSKYTTYLISNDGEIIEESFGKEVSFNLPSNTQDSRETYFRTKTCSSIGSVGWTQPLFI